ncbi:MAG: hypothetical protein ACK41E_04420 [Deinococcales bacterium]
MLQLVTRQQELRLRLLAKLYSGFVEDAHAWFDLDKLDLQSTPNIPRAAPDDEQAPELPRADFSTPPSPSEARAATLYLLERGLLLALPSETLQEQNIDPAKLMLRLTANGVDVLENFALANYQRATEQPIGFGVSQAPREEGMPLAEVKS